jgi:O-antigen/teichoic acid export membrane protein
MRTDLGSGAGAMARGATANLFGSAAGMGLAFLLTYVVTQFVPVREVGYLAIGTTVVGLAVIPAILGLETGVIRFVARGAALGDERAARASAQVALGIVAMTSAVLAVILWRQAPALADRFFQKPEAAHLLRIVSLALPGMALTRVAVGAVQGYGMMGYTAWLGIVRSGTNLAAALLLLAVGLGVEGVAIASVVTAYVALATALSFLFRTHPDTLAPARGAWQVGPMLRFSLPQTLTGLLFWAVLWTDTVLLGRFGTAAEVGIYAVATRLLIPASTISTAVGQMFAPRIAAEDARGDRATLSRMLKRVTYWNTAVSIPIFVTLALIPGPLLALFGPRYTEGATALAILALGQLLNTAAGPLGQVINMSGRPYITMLNNAFVAVVNLGACLVLIPRYGMVGASVSFAGSLTLVNLIKLVQVRVLFGMYPFRTDTLRAIFAAAVGAGLAAPVAFLVDWPDELGQVLVVTAIIFLGYVQVVRVLGLNPEDRALFAAGRAKIVRRLRPRLSR